MKKDFLKTALLVMIFVPSLTFAYEITNDPRGLEMDQDLVKKTVDLFKNVMIQRHGTPGNQKVYLGSLKAQRAVFLKTHGCAQGTFEVHADIPIDLKVGLFSQPVVKPLTLRVSSDTVPTTPDQKNSTVGIALKVHNVPGTKVLPGLEDISSQDFLLQNRHVFFVDNAHDFYRLFADAEAMEKEDPVRFAKLMKILDVDMAKKVDHVFRTTYWSTTPYRLGVNAQGEAVNYAKYKIIPCELPMDSMDTPDDPNYLTSLMQGDLQSKGACLKFQVQLRKSSMPLDEASVEWSETESQSVTVATLHLPPQKAGDHQDTCESMSFNPWHALPEHQPVGSINQLRGYVYTLLAEFRRQKLNGLPRPQE